MSEVVCTPFSYSQAPGPGRLESAAGPFDLSTQDSWRLGIDTDQGSDVIEVSSGAFDNPSAVTSAQLSQAVRQSADLVRMTPKASRVKIQRARWGSDGWLQVQTLGTDDDLAVVLQLSHVKKPGQDGIGEIAAPTPEIPQTTMVIRNESQVQIDMYGATILEGVSQAFAWNAGLATWEPQEQ
jgi:hypothetical protein